MNELKFEVELSLGIPCCLLIWLTFSMSSVRREAASKLNAHHLGN